MACVHFSNPMTRNASCLFCVPLCVIAVKRKMRHICVMSDDDAHFRLRIPRQLKEWVEESAKTNNRSINAEILSCIELARDGVVLHKDKAKESLDRMIEDAIRPFYEKVDEDLAKMKGDLQDFLASRKKG